MISTGIFYIYIYIYILTKTLEDNYLLDKTISTFEKDLKYLDIFSINMILEMIRDNKKYGKILKRNWKKWYKIMI